MPVQATWRAIAAERGAWGALLDMAGRAFVAVLYAFAHRVMQLATMVYFRRIEVLGREHFPRAGPVLLVVNHPSTWADVVVLDVALGRKLHFIAHESLFRPWPRGLVLRLFGSLPVLFHHERSDATRLNRATFARCHAAFRRGEVVAFFPEGVSRGDRKILPLKTGAARLLLEDPAPAGSAPILLPVAIGYEDRTAFRGDVTLAVGQPLHTETARIESTRSFDAAAHALTDAIAHALASALRRAADRAAPSLHRAPPLRSRTRRHAIAAALARGGRVLHALPVTLIGAATHRLASQPEQTAFGRILGGLVLLPIWYASLAAGALWLGGGPWLAVPIATPILGWVACREHDRRGERHARSASAAMSAARNEKTP